MICFDALCHRPGIIHVGVVIPPHTGPRVIHNSVVIPFHLTRLVECGGPDPTAALRPHRAVGRTGGRVPAPARQGLTLVHLSDERKRFLWDRGCV
jgi:hypothetical protein